MIYNQGQNTSNTSNNNNRPTYNNNNNTNTGPYNKTSNATPTTQTTSQTYPATNNNRNNEWKASHSPSVLAQSELRSLIFVTILLVYTVFNLIPYSIASDTSASDDTYFNVKLAGFCIAFIGVLIPFLMSHFNVNGCANPTGNSHSRLVNKVCGMAIIIGALLVMIGNIIFINDSTESSPLCESDNYVCCACVPIALLCIFPCFLMILVGTDLFSDHLSRQKVRIACICAIFILGILFILIPIFANDTSYSAVGEAVIAGYFGILIFSILAIISVFLSNEPMMKYVAILFGSALLLTVYAHSSDQFDNDQIVYVGFGAFVVYDLVN